ncbi:YceI family protein [Bacteroidota bacterium]
MKKYSLIILILLLGCSLQAQKFISKNGHIKFYSETKIETIEAHNHQVNCALNTKTGDFVFKVLMKAFEFKKALMQEHFNENYVESDKFPNATFKGKIENLEEVDFDIAGIFDVVVKGELSLHGITKNVSEKGTLEVKNGFIIAKSTFKIKLEDYDIKVPNTVINNISETIDIIVDVSMEEYKK